MIDRAEEKRGEPIPDIKKLVAEFLNLKEIKGANLKLSFAQ